jgi:hypothetical protein
MLWRVACASAVFTVLLLGGAVLPGAAPAASPKLIAVGKEPVEASPEPKSDIAKVALSLLNTGKSPTAVEVKLDATSSGDLSVRDYEPKQVQPEVATRVKVTLQGLKTLKDKPVEGQLVVSGGAEPVARTVSMKKPLEPAHNWTEAIFIVFGISFLIPIIGVLLWALLANNVGKVGGPAPGPKWSFSSWASSLTAVGGIFGTVLTSITFPPVPDQIEKESLVQLNLVFAALIIVGPFIFQAIRNPTTSEDQRELGLWGFSPVLLLTYALTCAAVIGEFAALSLLGWEVAGSPSAKEAVGGVMCFLAVLALYYFVVTAYRQVTTDWTDQAAKAKEAAAAPKKVIVVDSPPADAETALLVNAASMQLHARMP